MSRPLVEGDRVRWSDAFLARGRSYDPHWYDWAATAHGTVDAVSRRDGYVLVLWDGLHETCVHEALRLVLEVTP